MERWDPDQDTSLLEGHEVAARLDTSTDHGLSATEVAQRQAAYGPNELESDPEVPAWRRILEQFRDPLIYLLLAATGISIAAWALEGPEGLPVDALVIAVIVILNAVLGYVQEARAEQAVEALRAMTAPAATVVRDGSQVEVPTRELVPGDLLLLAEGDRVPADARLLDAATLKVAESSLTGESEPVLKDPRRLTEPAPLGDRLGLVFNGTSVTQGSGRAVVTATGMHTQVGRIAGMLRTTQQDPTPLQVEIAHVSRTLGIAVVAIVVVVVATILLAFGVDTAQDLVTTLLLGVSLAVAAVPEGLPAILSVVLALGVQRMAAHHAIVKDLWSVETLGSATVVCSDKTGTLTRGEMAIVRVLTPIGDVDVTGVGYRPDGAMERDGVPLDEDGELWRQTALVVSGGSLANDAVLDHDAGEWTIQGDPTEAAFLVAEAKLGTTQQRKDRFERVGLVPFTSERKLMTTLEADADRDGRLAVVTKGAPEVLLDRCTALQVGDGREPLDDTWRSRILTDVERMAEQGFRTLAVAYRPLGGADAPELDTLEQDLVYTGMVAIIDPPREEAATAIAEATRAGVRVVMITGDHPLTAARIAADLGITDTGERAVTGTDLDALDDDTFVETVRSRSVYARVTPEHKLRIVDVLQADGEVVAMTGDGVNDAPALKSADIGIAMGQSGTEVSKQAAKMILGDDNFATIVRAIREGREIFSNVRKFLRYLLSSNMGEVLTIFLGVVFATAIGLGADDGGLVLPLLATQVLWINLLTDTGHALAMGVDGEPDDLMARPPRRPDDRVIDARMWEGVFTIGLVMAILALVAIDLYLPGGMFDGSSSLDEARTVGFTVLVLSEMFNALNSRSETVSGFRLMFTNRWLWLSMGVSVVLQAAVVHLPWLNAAFSTEPMTLGQWVVAFGLASCVLWAGELRKLLHRRLDRRS